MSNASIFALFVTAGFCLSLGWATAAYESHDESNVFRGLLWAAVFLITLVCLVILGSVK